MKRERITNIVKPNDCIVHKSAKKGNSSFRITKKLLDSFYNKLKRVKKVGMIVINIPINDKEDYVLYCRVRKEKK